MKTLATRVRETIFALKLKHLANRPRLNIFKTKFRKRAILLYSPVSFLFSPDCPWYRRDTLYERNRLIAEILHKKGFVVDIVYYLDQQFVPAYHYDLVIDHGALHRKIWDCQSIKPRILMHIPTSYPAFQNQQERNRVHDFEKRTGIQGSLRRQVEEFILEYYSDILVLGNAQTRLSYPEKSRDHITLLPNYPHNFLFDLYPHQIDSKSKKCFLFLGGTLGAIHKGLDLLIEVFASTPDLTLYICGKTHREQDYSAAYSKTIRKKPNIIQIGWVELGDRTYQMLTKTCGFILLASCSEGMAGSVISGMASGLIPVVTEECGIDTGNWGYKIPGHIEGIRTALQHISHEPIPQLQIKSASARQHTKGLRAEFESVFWNTIPNASELEN